MVGNLRLGDSFLQSRSVLYSRHSFHVFYCTVTINHSHRVALLRASASSHTCTQIRNKQRLIYLVGYCNLQERIIFSNDTEKHWHTLAIVSIVSPDP